MNDRGVYLLFGGVGLLNRVGVELFSSMLPVSRDGWDGSTGIWTRGAHASMLIISARSKTTRPHQPLDAAKNCVISRLLRRCGLESRAFGSAIACQD